MAAKITVDIEAKVKGYQEAIEQMKAAFAKLDPGTTMAKSIKAGIQSAEAELKSLSRNMFPTASSEGQIDAIINKVNHLGDSIIATADKMKGLGINDLDLSAMDPQIQQLISNLDQLQGKFTETISQGMKETINNSQELSQAFKDLGIELNNNSTTDSILDAVIAKSEEAKQKVTEMEQAFSKAQKKYNTEVGNLTTLTNNPLFTNKDQIDKDLQNIASDYTNAINKLKPQLEQGLKSLDIKGGEKKREELLNNFLGGLTPENLRERLMELKNSVQAAAKETLSASEIYKGLFGDTLGRGGNASAIEKILLANIFPSDSVFNDIKTNFLQKLSEISKYLTDAQIGNVQGLLSKGQIDTALEKTLQYLQSAYQTLQGKVVKASQAVYDAIEGKDTARVNLEAAKTSSSQTDALYNKLQNQVNDLIQKNSDQQKQIEQLRNEIEERKNKSLDQVKQSGASAAKQASAQIFPTQTAQAYSKQLDQIKAKEQMVGKIQGVVQRWFSIYAAVRMVGQAIRSVISTIKELDATITEIAIVTNMTQENLWGQMDTYTKTAREYATSISGVYKVSQLYYQQGLQQSDVMALTEQTLKMARISGLEYATATDYMTNAVRSFKMEMTEAQTVVDVYSSIAASSATSVTELASAMSKTASSAQAVGSSFQNTTAMMAVMIEATRESAENIGSAMKSIISRYGEMTSDPSKTMDSEGQEMSLNRVDKALQTVGISIHDAAGQFRNFDEVIMELAEKWNTIDKNTQRYIATIMAGNRQQSRFLALVSSYDRLKELSQTAADSEDASQLQFLKTLDSVDAKTQQLQTSLQSLYVSAGIEKGYRTVLDIVNNIVKSLESLGKTSSLGAVIGKIAGNFTNTALLVTNSFNLIKQRFTNIQQEMVAKAKVASAQRELAAAEEVIKTQGSYDAETGKYTQAQWIKVNAARDAAQERVQIAEKEAERIKQLNKEVSKQQRGQKAAMVASAAGGVLTTWAASMDVNENRGLKTGLTGIGAALQGLGTGFMVGGVAGGIIGTLSALPGIIEAIGMASESVEEKVSRLSSAIKTTNNEKLQAKDELKTLTDYKTKYEELYNIRNKDAESHQAWIDFNNTIVSTYPELLGYIDEEGNSIANLTTYYQSLKQAKEEAYSETFLKNAKAAIKAASDMDVILNQVGITAGEGFYEHSTSTYGETKKWGTSIVKALAEGKSIPEAIQTGSEAVTMKDTGTSIISSLFTDDSIFKLTKKDIPWYDSYNSNFENIYDKQGKRVQYGKLVGGNWISGDISLFEPFVQSIIEKIINDNLSEDDLNNWLTSDYAAEGHQVKINSDVYKQFKQIGSVSDYTSNYQSKIIDYYLQEAQNVYKTILDIQENSLIINDTVTNKIKKGWEQYRSQHQDEDIDTAWENYYKGLGATITSLYTDSQGILSGINKINQEKVEKYYKNLDTIAVEYNTETDTLSGDLINFLTSVGATNELIELFTNKWKKDILQARKDMIEYIDSLQTNSKGVKISDLDLESVLNVIPQQFWPAIQEQLVAAYANIETNPIQASTQGAAILDLWTQVGKIKDIGQKEKVSDLIKNADLTSLIGIYTLVKSLQDANVELDESGIKQALLNLGETLSINIETEIQTFSNKITSSMSDFEKAISSATKGMDFKAAIEMTQKLGKRLTDFDFKDGKYYFNDLDLINKKYLSDNEEYVAALQEKIQQQNKGYAKYKTYLELWPEDQFDKKITEKKELFGEYGLNVDTIISQHNEFLKASEEERAKGFSQWLIDQNNAEAQAVIQASKKYIDYQINTGLLQNGYIKEFVDNITKDKNISQIQKDLITKAIASNNLESLKDNEVLWPLIKNYVKVISDTFSNVQAQIGKDLITSLQGGKNTVTVNQNNIEALKQNKGLFKSKTDKQGNTVEFVEGDVLTYKDAEEFRSDRQSFYDYIKTAYTTDKERLKALQEFYLTIYSDKLGTVTSLIGEQDSIDFTKFSDYLNSMGKIDQTQEGWEERIRIKEAIKYGLKFNELTGKFIIENQKKYIEQLTADLGKLDNTNSTLEERNALQAQIDAAKNKQNTDRRNAIKDITSNYKELTEDNIEKLATAFNLDYNLVKEAMDSNGDGTYRINITNLKALLNYDELGEVDKANIDAMIAAIHDDYLNAIINASSLVSKGTTKQADMENFVKEYNKLFETQKNAGDLFNYNEILESWTLNPEILKEYVAKQAEKLKESGLLKPGEVDKWIKTQTSQALAGNVNISEFLSSDNTDRNSKAYKKIAEAMRQYYENLFGDTKTPKEIIKQIESNIQDIKSGGTKAVEQVKTWAANNGREATSQEIEEAFSFAINELNDAMGHLVDLSVGQITTGKLREYLQAAGKVDENGVVTSVDDMVSVYQSIYNDMKHTAGNTTAGLNAAYAKVKTAEEQGDIDAIAAMGDAMGMTYDTLGQLLGKYDEDLETWMGNNEDLYTKIGNGKIRITDFDSFLQSVPGLKNIDKNSEEYLSAFNAYNDSLVALNRQTEKNILEEVQNVLSAKGGDQINLTYLSSKLGETAELFLSGTLQQYGASLTDGILTIREGANLVAITQEIISTATEAADLLPEEIADLKDAISEALQSFTDAINNGIGGKLTERGKLDLQTMAKNYLGIDASQLTFTQTVDGLKLSQQSAILLYQELKKIDELQASLVFDDLNKSLQDNNEHYKNVSDIMNRIKYLQDEIAKADGTVSNARRQEYEAELAVAKEILAVRSTSEDSSFDFMSNKIPGGQNNPLNYYSSWQKAIKTIEDGVKVKGKKNKTQYAKGFIDYQDFYNIATEMNNLAKISGQQFKLAGVTLDGSMEAASKLIQQGAASLQAVDTGELKVNLKSVGLDILGGANSLSEGVDAGIHAMAQSQIDMLDGLISLLETITAMEDLGDVAAESGDDLEIELPDIQIQDKNGNWKFTSAFEEWRKAKLAEIKEGKTGFAKAAEEVKIADKSLKDIIAQKAGEWTEDQAKILNSLWKAAKNGDWDVDNVAESMKKVLADAGLGDDANLTIDVGKTHYIVQGGAVVESINFESDGAKKSIDKLTKTGGKFAGDVEKAKKYIIKQVDAYTKGNPNNVKLDYTLIAETTGQLKYDKKSKKNYVTFQGKKYYGKEAIAKAMRGKEVAKALGINENKVTYKENKDIPNGKHSGKKTITLKDKSTVTYEMSIDSNGKTSWTVTDDKGKTYTGNSKENALKQWFNKISKVDENNGKSYVDINGHKYTFEQWMEVNFDTRVNTTTRFFGDGGKKLDISKSAGAQTIARDLLLKSNEELAKLVTPGKNGISQIKVKGFTLEFDTSTIATGGKANGDLVRQQLMATLGLDTNLAETITNGIVQAMPSISDALGKIGSDAKATAGLKKVADSVKTLADSFTNLKKINLVNLKKNLSQFFKNLAETSKQTGKNPLSIDELTAKLDNLIISSIADISLAEVEEGSEESSSLVLPQLTADLISLIISSIADISLAEVEEGEDSNVPSIDELKAALATLLINTVGGAQLTGAGQAAASKHTVKIIRANGHAETFNLDNTTATSKNGVITITGITTATGKAATLTITEVTGSKTLEDTDNVSAGEIKANAANAEVTAQNYKIQWKEIDENGQEIIVKEVTIPAKLGEMDLTGFTNGQYTATELTALIKAIFDAKGLQGKIDAGGPYNVKVLPELMDAYNNSYEDSVIKLYKGRKENQYTEQDFIDAAKTTALDRNKFGYDQYSNGEEYYQELLKVSGNSSLIQKMKESIIEGYNQGLKEIKQKKEKNEPEGSEKTQDNSKENENQPTTPTETSKAVEAMSKILSNRNLSLDNFTLKDYSNYLKNTETSAEFDVTKARQELVDYLKEIGKIPEDVNTDITTKDEFSKVIEQCQVDLAGLPANQIVNVIVKYTKEGEESTEATGNVSLATGNALGKGTLMGELGPELVVSHGRYFVAGQNGAEFVDLDKDAIVFNHLQTESLLKNGKAGRGKAKTNERNAVGMATGNVNGGPALASASSALSALKQLRAMWQSLLDASVQDMASKAGSGGGGGGGGGKKDKGFMKEVERWYTLMQRIAQLEKDINYQEQLRNKIMSDRNGTGKQYWLSQKKSLNDLGQEISYQKELAISQQSYFDKRRAELNKQSGFSKLYTFDASGQLVYNDKAKLKNGKKGGLSFLSDLFATDTKTGAAKYTDEQKYKKLIDAGLVGSKVYDENGNLIKKPKKNAKKDEWNTYYTEVVKSFSSKMDADKEEMQKLHDSIDDANEKVLELEQQRNEILNEMRDKYLELEDQVFNAVKELKQRAIDELQDLRDATEKSNQRYLDGLNAALQSEQNMYQKNESRNELDKMRRQLAILQRSGGSASQIASLQNDIRSKEQDQYFDERQSQIDAIQKASDNQIKKMDQQIEIMQKTLDYQVKYGLLWNDVDDIMNKSPKEIADFIKKNSSDYWGKSPEALKKANDELARLIDYVAASNQQRKLLESVKQVDEQWKGSATTVWDDKNKKWKIQYNDQGTKAALKKQYSKKVWDAASAEAEKQYYATYNRTGDPKAAAKAARKVLDDEKKKQEPAKEPTKEPDKTDDKKGGNGGKKTTAQLGRYQNKDGKTTFIGWYTLKAGQKTPSAPTVNGYKCISTNSTVPSSGAVAGKTYKVTYTYSKTGAEHGWVVTGTDKNGKKIRQEFSLKTYKDDYTAAIAAQNWLNKNQSKAKGTLSMSRYKRGGQVDYTGLAKVDGTPSRPEAFFNAEQTKILKNGLLGNSSRILASTLEEFNSIVEGMANGATYNTIDRGSSLVIENASVNMNVQSIANDYDARRAGEQALEQMMRIARKSGTKGVSRR